MPKKEKSFCKWKNDELAEAWGLFSEKVETSKYGCRNCGRSAMSKKNLCKPQKLAATR